MTSNFWELMWLILGSFFLIAYLMILFQIIVDLFRDSSIGGFSKAIWMIALIFLPMLTALVYVVFRGHGMAERRDAEGRRAKAEADQYIREVAQTSPADQIARAKALLNDGAITESEFAALKAKALV
jgi:hypothetical protein